MIKRTCRGQSDSNCVADHTSAEYMLDLPDPYRGFQGHCRLVKKSKGKPMVGTNAS